jgi:hypothetical protein
MKNAVIEYHLKIKRNFVVTESDKRRYYVRCSLNQCSFDLKFSVTKGKSTTRQAHDCLITDNTESPSVPVNYLCSLPEVQNWMATNQRDATTKCLKRLLVSLGFTMPTYNTLKRTLNKLREDMFISDTLQYGLLESYAEKLNARCDGEGSLRPVL